MASCPNCGAESVEKYCARCGQRFQVAQTMRALAREVADDQLGVDAKLPRTLIALFFKPGLLTSDYMAGRIARYIPPFRLYLLSSVLFFVLLAFLSRHSDWAEQAAREMGRGPATDTTQAARSEGTRRDLNVNVSLGGQQWLDELQVDVPWPWLDRKLEAGFQELGEMAPHAALRRMWDGTVEQLAKVMFILLPVYALLLKLLYVRRRRYYIEHFIFALHVHAFAFALFSLMLVFRNDVFVLALAGIMAVYTLLALRRVYGQSYIKTTIKWLALGFSYMIIALFGALLAAILAVAGTSAA